ncbi:MAG TPA: PEP-CTERM sorting domain-containing protein [Armatimonadota bacterium]
MRSYLIGAAVLAALALSSAQAVTLFDSGGFESYAAGDISGQHGWQTSGYHMGGTQPVQPALITPFAGHGNVVEFNDVEFTQTPIEINFANITGTYKYAQASFDYYRDGTGNFNNLVFWPNGNNPWGGWFWDNASNAPSKLMPFGFGTPAVNQTPNAWMNVSVLFDLQNGLGTGWVNGVKVADNINIGTGDFAGWYFSDNNTVDQGRTPGAIGEKAYLDNFNLVAGNSLSEVPEPSSLALLAGGLLPLLALRKRR